MFRYHPTVLHRLFKVLCQTGAHIEPVDRTMKLLPGLTFRHEEKGEMPVEVDCRTLQKARVYVRSTLLREALQEEHIQADPLNKAYDFIMQQLGAPQFILGVSGYATPGHPYKAEGDTLVKLYSYLASLERLPGLVIDGGVSDGVLGLNSIVAMQHRVPTLGCIPLQGLGSVGLRDHMIVWGDTYKDREQLVGTLADILVCLGGKDGTRRECEAALAGGSPVLLLAPKAYRSDSFASTCHNFPKVQKAIASGQLVVCGPDDDPTVKLSQVLRRYGRVASASRSTREFNLTQLLCSA